MKEEEFIENLEHKLMRKRLIGDDGYKVLSKNMWKTKFFLISLIPTILFLLVVLFGAINTISGLKNVNSTILYNQTLKEKLTTNSTALISYVIKNTYGVSVSLIGLALVMGITFVFIIYTLQKNMSFFKQIDTTTEIKLMRITVEELRKKGYSEEEIEKYILG